MHGNVARGKSLHDKAVSFRSRHADLSHNNPRGVHAVFSSHRQVMQVMGRTYFGNGLARKSSGADDSGRGGVSGSNRPSDPPCPRRRRGRPPRSSPADAGHPRRLAELRRPAKQPPAREASVWPGGPAPAAPPLTRVPTTASLEATPTTGAGTHRTPLPTRLRHATAGQADDSWPTERQRTTGGRLTSYEVLKSPRNSAPAIGSRAFRAPHAHAHARRKQTAEGNES